MEDSTNCHDKLKVEEDEILSKIQFCEGCLETILMFISNNCECREEIIGEEIVMKVHTIEQDLRTELLHLRLEKGILAGRMMGS